MATRKSSRKYRVLRKTQRNKRNRKIKKNKTRKRGGSDSNLDNILKEYKSRARPEKKKWKIELEKHHKPPNGWVNEEYGYMPKQIQIIFKIMDVFNDLFEFKKDNYRVFIITKYPPNKGLYKGFIKEIEKHLNRNETNLNKTMTHEDVKIATKLLALLYETTLKKTIRFDYGIYIIALNNGFTTTGHGNIFFRKIVGSK